MEALPLECRGLSKRFGPIVALDAVDLTVHPGSIAGFLGPNGAGKSTLLRIVTGLIRASAGSAAIFGHDVSGTASAVDARRRLGSMPADPVFYPVLTGRENLDLLASLQGAPPVARADACVALDLGDDILDRAAGTYSSGMRQKLGIVQAIQHRPDLVVLDEPANRLDPIAHHAFVGLMRSIADEGRAVLLSSHTLSEVQELCDRVVMIQRGKVLLAAGADDLLARARRLVTVRYEGAPPTLPGELSDVRPATEGTALVARMRANDLASLRRVIDTPGVVDVLVEPARLEDVFLDLYAEDPS